MGFNIGGMAAAYEGFKQGQDDETARQQRQADIEYQKTQRDFQGVQQARQRDQWQREDDRRAGDMAAPTTREVTQTVATPYAGLRMEDGRALTRHDDQYPDQEMPAVTSQVKKTVDIPMEEQLRGFAKRAQAAGATDEWLKINLEADKLEGKRMSAKLQDAAASAQGKDPFEAAQILASVFSPEAGTSLHMVNPRKNADKSVTVDVYSRESGSTTPRTYKTTDELVKGAMALADPTQYAAIMAKAREAEEERKKEFAKPVTTAAGAVTTFAPGDPRAAQHPGGRVDNTNGMAWNGGFNPDGAPTMTRPPAGKGSGSQHTTGGEATEAAFKAFEFVATKGGEKLPPDQMARGARLTQQFMTERPRIAPEVAAEAALDATMHPEKAEPSIDPKTGQLLTAYTHPELGQFVISRTPPANLKPEQMALATKTMIEAQDPKLRDDLVRAAFDPKEAQKLMADVEAELDKATNVRVFADQANAAQIRAQMQAVKAATTKAIGEKLKLIKQYSKAPGADGGDGKPSASAAERHQQIGGLRVAAAAGGRALSDFAEADRSSRVTRAPAAGMDPASRSAKEAQLRSLALTPEKIRALPPSKARELVDKFDDVLDPQTLQALRRQI